MKKYINAGSIGLAAMVLAIGTYFGAESDMVKGSAVFAIAFLTGLFWTLRK